MLFNSIVFLQFFAAFVLLYWLCRNRLRARNLLIVAASYLFYGWWDWRLLSLLFASSLLDYSVALGMQRSQTQTARKWWLAASLTGNLGMLGFFKYWDFFVTSFSSLLNTCGFKADWPTLNIILPVGISFYTFQTLSYALDVYRKDIKATRDFVGFLAYVSFFPQLVAGPIERASHLLPQFEQTRVITRTALVEGVWLMIWGMFKKVVIADNMAPLADLTFHDPHPTGLGVVLGTIAFGFQIYGDFSGYSDIARGSAQVLGFDIMWNFHLPYFASNVREFWRRWHISLSTWLRDYLYIGMGGNRLGTRRTRLNLLFTMLLGGLWHGAALNYIFWGLWHGLGLLIHRWWEGNRTPKAGSPRGGESAVPRKSPLGWAVSWLATMAFVFYGWLVFRSGSMESTIQLTLALVDPSPFPWLREYAVNLGFFLLPLLLMQVWQARSRNMLVAVTLPPWARHLLQAFLILAIAAFWRKDATPFIYFQF